MTFMEWVKQYEGQNNRYGDLAGDIQADHRFPMVDDYHTINDHLVYMNACSGAHGNSMRGRPLCMDDKAREERNAYMREYMKEYRKKNREKINAQKREWNRNNPDKVKQHRDRFWGKRRELIDNIKRGEGNE